VELAAHVVVADFDRLAGLHDVAQLWSGLAGSLCRTRLRAGANGFDHGLLIDAELHVRVADLDCHRVGANGRHGAASRFRVLR
jgi:hypothetical protein